MLTLAEAEARHNALKRRMREIRRSLRDNENVPGLCEELDQLITEVRSLAFTLRRSREIAEYLCEVQPYGPPQ